MPEEKFHFDLAELDPQHIENLANAFLVAAAPFYKGRSETDFDSVSKANIECAVAMMVLITACFRDQDIDDNQIMLLMRKICKFALTKGGTSRFVRVE